MTEIMKKLLLSAVMYCLTFSAYAQTNVEDKVFLNNLIILTSVSGDLEYIKNWTYADLDIKDISDKNVSISKYPYVNRFGEWVLSPESTKSDKIMGYNTANNELKILFWTIDYNERKRLNDFSSEWSNDHSIRIIPSETPLNQEVRIQKYSRTGEPLSDYTRIKYDEKKRIIAIIPSRINNIGYIHIKYNADNSIVSFSTIESFNPKEYVIQKHQKVEYIWSENNIKSVRLYQIIQSVSGNPLVLQKTIDCEVVEKNDAGLWTVMDIVEKSNLDESESDVKTIKYRLIRGFNNL